MNVLNVIDVERELAKFAARAEHPQISQWVLSVPRNYILSKLPEKDVDQNFVLYDPHHKNPVMPKLSQLPDWAKQALEKGEFLHWFDPFQTKRRTLWQSLGMIVMWFNTFAATDTRLRRADRINFETATKAAALWFKDVTDNIWDYVKDKPPVVKTMDNGYYWVRMTTALHFEREGKLMKHCVGNGGYYENWRRNKHEYFSLRDKHNKPHATMEVTGASGSKGAVVQCKGSANGKPGHNYQRYIRPFITSMGWGINGDSGNID